MTQRVVTVTLYVRSVTTAVATLTLTNYGVDWWHQGSQSNAACAKVAAGTSAADLSSLTAGTSYT